MKDKNSLTDMLMQIGLTKKLAGFYLYILESGPIDLKILLQKSSHRGVAEEKTKLLEDLALRKLVMIDRYSVFPLNPKTVFKAVGHLKLWQDIVDWDIERVSENNKMKIKETLTGKERETLIQKLTEDYSYYINDSDDEELQQIYNSSCFTVGSMNYYKELDKQVKRNIKRR